MKPSPMPADPEHHALSLPETRRIFQDSVHQAFSGRVLVLADAQPFDGHDALRLTDYPFFKLCLSGHFRIGDQVVAPGDACLFVAGSFVNDRFPQTCRFFRLTTGPEQSLLGIEYLGGRSDKRLQAHIVHRGLPFTGQAVLDRLAETRDAGKAGNLVRVLLDEIDNLLTNTPAAISDSRRRYHDILHYLHEHAGSPIDRTSTARSFGISAGHVSRLFTRFHHRGFTQELTAIRLDHAKRLLRGSAWGIERIAERCGFSSPNYFGQAFRQTEGCSPHTWRKQHGQ
jgi:AraC-like DNA-binding protein